MATVPGRSGSIRTGDQRGSCLDPDIGYATSLSEHRGRYLMHLDDHVGWNIIAPCRISNRLNTLSFVKTISLALVGAEKSQQPLDSFLIVDEVNSFCSLLCHLETFGEIPLDHETWHGP